MKNKDLQRVTLEMSLKPFKSLEQEAMEEVCVQAIQQWMPLIGQADKASVLLWVADGSEILVWNGDLEAEMEWAKYIGFANEWQFSHNKGKSDPRTAIHYTEHPVNITYGDLKNIIATLKKVAKRYFNLELEVGATFDAGPEFAYSDFKYKDHQEINRAELGGEFIALKADYTVVCSWSKLKADNKAYAAYPNGIPEDTPFGEFLGKQCANFLPACGFDYIWFSNGFALSYFPWTYLGANYDGNRLPLTDYQELSEKVLSFWDLFKQECPDYRTEIRGTNFGTGMDLAKDYIPLRDLYEKEYVEYPPPNSPWGALNYDFGLEMVGYMSRIAELPKDTYPFRYYPNDPWFWQNPWTDLYDGEPHDIYLPLSAGRLNIEGEMEGPKIIEFLSIDTEKGELREEVALEVITHIRKGLRDFPTEPGLVTWIYPFDELHDKLVESNANTSSVFFNDWFVRNAINEGLPLNTVVSSRNYRELIKKESSIFENTVLMSSTFWLDDNEVSRLKKHVQNGGHVLLYGAINNEKLRTWLNLKVDEGIEGEAELLLDFSVDLKETKGSRKMLHHSLISDGKMEDVLIDPSKQGVKVKAKIKQDDKERIFALSQSLEEWNGGKVIWVRGSLPYKEEGVTHLPVRQSFDFFDSSIIVRYALQEFGYTILQEKQSDEIKSGLMFVARKDNGLWFTGCKQDTSISFNYMFPEGTPLLIGQTVDVGNKPSKYSLNRSFHEECRIFVDQTTNSHVSCRELAPQPTPNKVPDRRILITGLQNANITIYPPVHALEKERVEIEVGNKFIDMSDKVRGNKVVIKDITGDVQVSW